MTFDIAFPRDATPQSLANFSKEMDQLPKQEEIRIDTSALRFFYTYCDDLFGKGMPLS